jgi:hypothetical protein
LFKWKEDASYTHSVSNEGKCGFCPKLFMFFN